jgi:PAS domain-containing protein
MKDPNRTPEQLQEEVVRLRKRLSELEALEAKHARVEKDLTEAREELEQRERFLSNVFSSIQDGISVLDTDLNIIRVNPTMERWYSHAMPLKDKKCFLAYHDRDKLCEVCPTRKTLNTGEAAYEIVPKTGAGGKGVGWLDLYSFPLFDNATGQLNRSSPELYLPFRA